MRLKNIDIASGRKSVNAGRDFDGSIDAQGIVSVAVGGDMSGSISTRDNVQVNAGGDCSGDIETSDGDILGVAAAGDISSNVTADEGNIDYVIADGSVSGDITSGADIGEISASSDISSDISSNGGNISLISAGHDVSGTIDAGDGEISTIQAAHDISGGDISADTIDALSAGNDLSSDVDATTSLGSIAVGHSLTGDLTAEQGSIGNINAGGSWADADTASGSIEGSTITAGTSVGSVEVVASPGYEGAISGVAIDAGDGSIGAISAVSGIDVTATASDSIGSITTDSGDISGSFTAANGDIGDVTAADGDISANVSAEGGNIGDIEADGDISGTIVAGYDIGDVTSADGDISGAITSSEASIGNVTAGGDLSGNVSAGTDIGDVTSGGDLSGNLDATNGNIGDVGALGDLSGKVTAHAGSIGMVAVVGQISNDLSSSSGSLEIVAIGDITGQVSSNGTIQILTLGNVSGAVSGKEAGQVDVFAAGTVTSALTSIGNMFVDSVGTISGQVTSSRGSASLFSSGSVSTTADVQQDLVVFGSTVDTQFTGSGGAFAALSSINTTGSIKQPTSIAPDSDSSPTLFNFASHVSASPAYFSSSDHIEFVDGGTMQETTSISNELFSSTTTSQQQSHEGLNEASGLVVLGLNGLNPPQPPSLHTAAVIPINENGVQGYVVGAQAGTNGEGTKIAEAGLLDVTAAGKYGILTGGTNVQIANGIASARWTGVDASVAVTKVTAQGSLGDNNGLIADAQVRALAAEAKASWGRDYSVTAKAEFILAEASASGGVKVLGIPFKLEATARAGAEVGASVGEDTGIDLLVVSLHVKFGEAAYKLRESKQ